MQWAFFVLFIWYFSCALFWFCLVSCEPLGSEWAMLPFPYLINLLLLFYWKYFLFLWHESFLCFHNSWILSLYTFLEILNVPLICFFETYYWPWLYDPILLPCLQALRFYPPLDLQIHRGGEAFSSEMFIWPIEFLISVVTLACSSLLYFYLFIKFSFHTTNWPS